MCLVQTVFVILILNIDLEYWSIDWILILNIDPFAWESYKNGLAAEKRSKQMDISSMFNLDDIDEPEWANLNERICDAVWNVDPD